MSERHYSPTKSYGQSKLALLIFSRELQRRSDAGLGSARASITSFLELVSTYIGQTSQEDAPSILFVATSTDVEPGACCGPIAFLELKGPPGLVTSTGFRVIRGLLLSSGLLLKL